MRKTDICSLFSLILTVLIVITITVLHLFEEKKSLKVDETIELNFDNSTKRETIITLEIEDKEYDSFLIEAGFFDDVKRSCEERDGQLAWNRVKNRPLSHWIEIGHKTNFDDTNLLETYEEV